MPDTPNPAPPATAPPSPPPASLPNPVLPPGGIPGVQSALERHAASVQGGQVVPPSYSDEHAHQLEQARAADLRAQQAAATLAAQPERGHEQQAQPPGDSEPLLKPRHSNNRTVRRASDWETLKGERDQLRAEVERLRSSVPAATADIDVTKLPLDKLRAHPDIARLTQERDTFYEEVKHTRVEADPEFKAKWDARTNAVMNTVKRVAGKAADEVAAILSDRDPDRRMAALAERIKDFGEGSKHQLIAAAAQLSAMEIERDIDVATRKATWDQTQASRKQAEQGQWSQKLAAMNNEFDHVWQEACHPESGIPFLMDDKVKAAVLPDARRVFTGESSAREIAKASLQAALFSHVVKSAMQAWSEVERLQAANGAYAGAWPTDGGAPLGEAAPPPPISPTASYNYDRVFGQGIEQARQADLAGKGWGR